MKHHLALIMLITFAVCCLGQGEARGQINPPTEVKQNFYDHFKDATETSWSKKDAYYFAHFKQERMRMEAKYTLTGKWISTDIFNISRTQLPANLIQYLDEKHSGQDLQDIFFHDEPDNSYYKIKLRGSGKVLHFHDNGNFWK